MKKTWNRLICCMMLLSLGSCDDTIRIGILFDTTTSDRWKKDKEELIRHINDRHAEAIYYDTDGTHEKQLEYCQMLINKKIELLILVAADLNKAAEIVDIAHKNNIKVVAYDRLIQNTDLDFYISFDNVEVGRMQAKYLTNICPNGKYAIIGGAPKDNNAYLLRIGHMNILEPLEDKGEIEIFYEQFADYWAEEEGYRHMKTCLNKSPVNAVVAANDQLANGAIRALKERGLAGKVCVSGQDATVQGCKNIVKGYQSMTVYKPIEIIADSTISIAFKLLQQKIDLTRYTRIYNGKSLVPALLQEPIVVDKNNLDSVIVKSGYISREAIYKPANNEQH